MDALIRELQALSERREIPDKQVVGAILAATIRFRDVLNNRMVGIQALATAIARQPQIDSSKLHDDFVIQLKQHFESMKAIPQDLRDVANAIKLAAIDP